MPLISFLKTWFDSNIGIFEENAFWKTITKLYQVAKSYVLFFYQSRCLGSVRKKTRFKISSALGSSKVT